MQETLARNTWKWVHGRHRATEQAILIEALCQCENLPSTSEEPNNMPDTAATEVIVIGAGIAGASVAARLAPHRSVLLLERETQPGYHSTGRSAAMFMESYGPPTVRALTRASRQFFLHPPPGFTDVALLGPRGALFLAQTGQQNLLQQLQAELGETCPQLQRLDRQQTMDILPCLRPETVHASLLDPLSMDIDVNALHQGFLKQLRRCGGHLLNRAEVVSAQRKDAIWQVQLADGETLRAAVVVNAAGAWAEQVGSLFGAQTIGLVPHRRSAFTFQPPADTAIADWPVVSSLDDSWYFKPDAGVLLGSPANADPTTAHDVVPEELDIATAIHHIEAATHLQIRRPIRTWAGLRSFVPDGELVIGWDRSQAGFFWLVAQGGYGIQSAPAASDLAAALVLQQQLPEHLLEQQVDLSAMSPLRLE
jgi:D-arginine dehydrogenase